MSDTNKVPTALEVIQQKRRYDGIPPTPEEVAEMMIDFAKAHLEKQREAIKLNVKVEILEQLKLYHVDKESIDQAYNIEENVN